jgi:poly(A) polymerase
LSGERIAKELLKLLAAPDPRPAVRLMERAGVLAMALPQAHGLERFEAMVDLTPDPLLRLSALLSAEAAAVTATAERLRLSNAQRERLLDALPGAPPVSPDMGERGARAAIYRLGRQAFADRLLRAAAEGPQAGEGTTSLLALAERWAPPRFPLGGHQAMAAGAQGAEVGRLLRAVEDWWVQNDFPETGAIERLTELAKAR